MQLCVLIVLSSLHFLSAQTEDDLPEYIRVCHRSDPQLEKCIAASIETLRPFLKTGITELNIPRCEPLLIPEFVISQGKGPISMTSTYKNIFVTGASGFRLDSIRTDLERNRVEIQLFFPQLRTTSNYSMKGQIMILPLESQGISYSNYSDIAATCSLQGKEVTIDGRVHWLVEDLLLALEIGSASIRVEGLFPRNPELGTTLNRFLNDNWRSVAEEIKPALELKLGDMFKEVANHIFTRFPMDILLPP